MWENVDKKDAWRAVLRSFGSDRWRAGRGRRGERWDGASGDGKKG